MSSSLGYFPYSSVNIRIYNRHNWVFPFLGNTIVEINNLTLSKYQSYQVQMTTSAPPWFADTYFLVLLQVSQLCLIMSWNCIHTSYAHIYDSWVQSYPIQVNYWHFQYHPIGSQLSCWTKQLIHTLFIPSKRCHLSIGPVVQNLPLTKKTNIYHTCLLLDWKLCGASHQHNTTFTCKKAIHIYWSPDSSIHQSLPQIIFILLTSKYMLFFLTTQHRSSWVHTVSLLLLFPSLFLSETIFWIQSKIHICTWC